MLGRDKMEVRQVRRVRQVYPITLHRRELSGKR